MDPFEQAENVRITNENFAPVREFLIHSGVLMREFERRGFSGDLMPYWQKIQEALALPLWPYNHARVIRLVADKSLRKVSWPVLKKLLYEERSDKLYNSETDPLRRRAMLKNDYVVERIVAALGENVRKSQSDELLELLNDERLGSNRILLIPAVRRVFGEKAKSILIELAKKPSLKIEATHQLRKIERKLLSGNS